MSRRSSRIAKVVATAVETSPSAPAAKKARLTAPKSTSIAPPKAKANVKSAATASTKQNAEEPVEDDGLTRCAWANNPKYPLMQRYHDEEWYIPGGCNRTNRYLFEMLILEGAQAGLSWSTVLHKRSAYCQAYNDFDYNLIADTFVPPQANERLLQTNIVKNKLKVQASITNAKLFRDLLQSLYPDQAKPEDEQGFWVFLQQYAAPPRRALPPSNQGGWVTTSPESDRLSADLKARGFKFVGSTIMYAYLQACGILLDDSPHSANCHKHPKHQEDQQPVLEN